MHNKYTEKQKEHIRALRSNMTKQEVLLWQHLRGKQVHGIKFLRQKLLLGYVLDFYSHQVKLAIEIDGSQHYDEQNITYDKNRDYALNQIGIDVLRYSNRDIDLNFNNVMDDIYNQVQARV